MTEKLDVNVTVILPTLNEEEGVGETIDAIPKNFCKELEVLIVDGNSSDKTREIAQKKGAAGHVFVVLSLFGGFWWFSWFVVVLAVLRDCQAASLLACTGLLGVFAVT